jgi:hypothetical protein
MSEDGISAALCHELGHAQIGVEEQKADVFAGQVCLPVLWRGEPATALNPPLPQQAAQDCGRAPDPLTCRRILSSGLSVANFRYWYATKRDPSGYPYTRPDFFRTAASSLDIGQCSLDVYGALALGARLPPCYDEGL